MAWRDLNLRQKATALLVGGVVLYAVLGQHKTDPQPSIAAQAQPAAPSLSVGTMNAKLAAAGADEKWQSVSFNQADGRAFRVYAVYARPPRSISEVRADGDRIAKAALDAIHAGGVDPWKNGTFLSVYLQRAEGSVAGREMIRRYGRTTFSANTGRFDFEAE